VMVWGEPRTKGSVAIQRGRRVVQAVEGSAQWAEMVRRAVVTAMERQGVETLTEGPVSVHLRYWLDVTDVTVKGPGSGDTDKLDRNILDALTKAKAYGDDVQVVRIVAEKWPCDRSAGIAPGVAIELYRGYV
jgi:Holliday junction resolvase RusA-like endonuclease